MRVTVSIGNQCAGKKREENVFQNRIESFERRRTYFLGGRYRVGERMIKNDRKCGISN